MISVAATATWPRLMPPSLHGIRECTSTRRPAAESRLAHLAEQAEVLEHAAGERDRPVSGVAAACIAARASTSASPVWNRAATTAHVHIGAHVGHDRPHEVAARIRSPSSRAG